MFSVFLENQHVKAQVGWHPKERSQRVDLWISILAEIKPGNLRDDLSRTLDYAALVGIVIIESSKERKLLETLAVDIVSAIELANPSILKSIEITIRKKQVDVTGYQADGVGVKFKKVIDNET